MFWLSTHLPDTLVRFLPMRCCRVSNRDQKFARRFVKLPDLVAKETDRTEDFTVNIELALLPCVITDAHRLASTPASQVAERPFAEVVLTADAKHDLKSGTPLHLRRHRASYPVEEAGRFIGASRDPERFQGHTGVTHPGVTVVPVTLSSDRLRQRGGWRGDDGSGGPKHKCL